MPELPEIHTLANQMNRDLTGKVISGIEVIRAQKPEHPARPFRRCINWRSDSESHLPR